MAAAQKFGGDRAPDEPGAASDKNPPWQNHASILLLFFELLFRLIVVFTAVLLFMI
jgi:hypothetical protein